ncbi:GH1 family beta-glucosidase [Acrocarpospora catenulata]|uniref:GH1 family beta-glucosidase n=1 Tax=Acrocarpospora catenulata TaxID=2836182 RepID=UPI0027E0E93C|nr:GH1 family beta-glucosidase [Acrocarpospora catenulata]
MRRFPDEFIWGAATASYQIEGAVHEDGRGPSIWDVFSHTPGKVVDGHTGDVACDHYHRYREDVAIMADLGLQAYRFSVAWPRVQPGGSGPANPAGLDFYDRLVDELLARGIAPIATLYHWDLPAELDWRDRATADRFAEYAALVYGRLGDRVGTWTTLNEPWVSAFVGYGSGRHAPGIADPAAAFTAAHHLLRAHALGVRALRAGGAREVSLTLNLSPMIGDPSVTTLIDGLANRLFLDPALRGGYPEDVLAHIAKFTDLDEPLFEPIDLLGINYYTVNRLAADPASPGHLEYPGSEGIAWLPPHGEPTEMGWEVIPSGLYDLLMRLTRDYPGTPLMITENGCAYPDTIQNGQVPDPARIAYLEGHFQAAHQAITDGAPLRGYLVWSLLDNFEWARGYHKRFGLIHVGYDSLERLPKSSAHWYREVIARNGLASN